jgi:trehalose utilization protein
MKSSSRRGFLQTSSAIAGGSLLPAALAASPRGEIASRPASAGAINVVVWDERQPAQKEAYADFLGNQIANHLSAQPGMSVRSVSLNDPDQGLGSGVLDGCNVLIWWGHVRHAEITPETGQAIVARIKAGTLALVALHSAHWSTPFVEAMNERTRMDFGPRLQAAGKDKVEVEFAPPPRRYTVPAREAQATPYVSWRKYPSGAVKATVHLPYCCFPAYRNDGKPSFVRVVRPEHPIVEGVSAEFELPQTEMYDEPFHVPEPDLVVMEERWASGEWFRSGAVWKLGRGRVFYFRPGHETYPIYKQPIPLRIITNAVRWLGAP